MTDLLPDGPDGLPVRLLLVRHAHVESGSALGAETPLSARGEAQADWLGPALGGESVTALVSSPFVRARATAERIARTLALEVRVEAALREFVLSDDGVRSYAEVQAARPDLAVWHPEHRGAGESLADFQTRVTALLTSLVLHASAGDTLAIVTHAGVIDAALRWAWGLTSRNAWMAETAVPHASVTEIAHWPRGRHPEGAPRFSVVRRLGDASAIPGDLLSE